jgi:hypothetical protein
LPVSYSIFFRELGMLLVTFIRGAFNARRFPSMLSNKDLPVWLWGLTRCFSFFLFRVALVKNNFSMFEKSVGQWTFGHIQGLCFDDKASFSRLRLRCLAALLALALAIILSGSFVHLLEFSDHSFRMIRFSTACFSASRRIDKNVGRHYQIEFSRM